MIVCFLCDGCLMVNRKMVLFLEETCLINQDWRNSIMFTIYHQMVQTKEVCVFNFWSLLSHSCQVLRFEILQMEKKRWKFLDNWKGWVLWSDIFYDGYSERIYFREKPSRKNWPEADLPASLSFKALPYGLFPKSWEKPGPWVLSHDMCFCKICKMR